MESTINENSETIWSHTFKVVNKQIELPAYEDRAVTVFSSGPSEQLSAAIKRVGRKISTEQLEKVHVTSAEDAA